MHHPSKPSLAAGDNLVLEVGISDFFVVPHDAVLHCQVLELAVVPDGHVRADGTVLDGDILPDDARGNQPGIVNGTPLVNSGAADVVEFVLVLQQPRPEIGAFPGQGRGRALAARNRGVTPRFPRLEGRAQLTSGPPGPTGFDP